MNDTHNIKLRTHVYLISAARLCISLHELKPPPLPRKGRDRAFEYTISPFLPTYQNRLSYAECRRRIVEQLTI